MRENFWHFSNQIYRRPGVAETCLDLQNSKAADVNLLLFACWYGVNQGLLPEDLIQRSLEYSQLWSIQVVVPLRQARTWMKQSAALPDSASLLQQHQQLREQIKAAELQAEHFQQNLLESMIDDSIEELNSDEATQGQHVRINLLRYLPAHTDPEILKLLSDNAVAVHQS